MYTNDDYEKHLDLLTDRLSELTGRLSRREFRFLRAMVDSIDQMADIALKGDPFLQQEWKTFSDGVKARIGYTRVPIEIHDDIVIPAADPLGHKPELNSPEYIEVRAQDILKHHRNQLPLEFNAYPYRQDLQQANQIVREKLVYHGAAPELRAAYEVLALCMDNPKAAYQIMADPKHDLPQYLSGAKPYPSHAKSDGNVVEAASSQQYALAIRPVEAQR